MAGRVSIIILDNGASSASVAQSSTQLVIGTSSLGTVGAPFASTSLPNISTNFGVGPLPEAMGLVAAVGGVPIGIKATANTAGAVGAVTTVGGGTSVVTATGTPFDTLYILMTVVAAGTIGTAGITFTISYDAGRTTSPLIALGTATTYLVPNSGITLNFAAGTMLVAQTNTVATVEGLWNDAGIQAAITAFLGSSYKTPGVGSVHVVGGAVATNLASGAAGADMMAIGGYLQSARLTQYVFNRAIISARDTKVPVAYGGAAETEAAWMTALNTDFQGQSLNYDTSGRICACAAYWNIQSAFALPGLGVAPRYRRSVAYALAQRVVLIPRQRMPSRVRDGALSPIVTSPADKLDGFLYHDESISPGLDSTTGGAGGNFATTTTIVGKNGVFLQHANLMAPTGSQYGYLPQGFVTDDACSLAYQTGINNIDDEVRTVGTGTIDPRDAASIGLSIQTAIAVNMTNQGELTASATMPDGCTAIVDQTINVAANGVAINLTLNRKSYILKETITIGAQPGT